MVLVLMHPLITLHCYTSLRTVVCILRQYPVFRMWKWKINLCFFILGIPRVSQCNFSLPLKLVCFPAQPSKAANHKLTIDTNKPPISFVTIFPGRFLNIKGVRISQQELWSNEVIKKAHVSILKNIFWKKWWHNISIIIHLGKYTCLW